MEMIRLEKVSKYYKSIETVSVGMKNVSLSLDLNEFVAITGESGSGKSTLLNVISGLDGYEDGELFVFNEETSHYTISDWEKYRGTYIGFVFQNYNIIDAYTVYQNVMLALEVQGYSKKDRKKRALELIDKVGLTSHKNHKASKLSGGQKQRAVIARALAKDCPIIVADEPTGNLDSKSSEQVMELLFEISKDKLVLVVTHDFDQVKAHATRRIKMLDGEIIEDKKLKKIESSDNLIVPQIKRMGFKTLLRFALRNLFSTPKKLVFLLLLQVLLLSSFTLVFSNQIQQVREANFSDSSRSFANVPVTRLLVERRDGAIFTSNELDLLSQIKSVKYIHPQADLFFNRDLLNVQPLSGGRWGYVDIRGTDTSLQLRPLDVDGKIPEKMNEIVITNSRYGPFSIGDHVTIDASGRDYMSNYPIGTFVITGFDRLQRNILYFSEAFLNQERTHRIDYSLKGFAIEQIQRNMVLEANLINQSFELSVSKAYWDIESDIVIEGGGNSQKLLNQTMTLKSKYNNQDLNYVLNDVSVTVFQQPYVATLSMGIYDQVLEAMLVPFQDSFTIPNETKMISIGFDSAADGNRIIDNLDASIYRIYYPAIITSPLGSFLKFIAGVVAFISLTVVGSLLYLAYHSVTKNIMNARKKDFAIFRSIGTNQYVLARLVVLEQVIISLIGFALSMGILTILRMNITFIRSSLSYMRELDYLLLIFIVVVIGVLIGLRFNRKVFNMSVIETLSQSRGDQA